ncbi:MAG: protein kinase [Chlamydiia bacterium]|nr:protein kinase [Chlamydiia bacterium]
MTHTLDLISLVRNYQKDLDNGHSTKQSGKLSDDDIKNIASYCLTNPPNENTSYWIDKKTTGLCVSLLCFNQETYLFSVKHHFTKVKECHKKVRALIGVDGRRIVEWSMKRYKEPYNRIEMTVHAIRDHPNVMKPLKLGGYRKNDDMVRFQLSRYLKHGTLMDTTLNFMKQLEIAIGIMRGIATFHEKGRVHGDIKLENIFITDDFKPILADFEHSSTVELYNSGTSGTLMYSSMQIEKEKLPKMIDIWAAACVLYYLFFQQELTSQLSLLNKKIEKLKKELKSKAYCRKEIDKQIRNERDRIFIYCSKNIPRHHIKPKITDLVKEMFSKNPKKRPSAIYVMNELEKLV